MVSTMFCLVGTVFWDHKRNVPLERKGGIALKSLGLAAFNPAKAALLAT